MKKKVFVVVSLLLISCSVFAASPVPELARKMPEDTLAFIATSGLNDFEADFKQTPLGQIYHDQQVQDFVKQIVSTLTQMADPSVNWMDSEVKVFLTELLSSPVMLGVALDPESDAINPFSVYLICKDTSGTNKLIELYAGLIENELQQNKTVKKRLQGYSVYTSNDPNQTEVNYAGQVGNYFIAGINDADYTLLSCLSQRKSNYPLSRALTRIKDTQDAWVGYVDIKSILSMLQEESAEDDGFKAVMNVLARLGLSKMESFLCCGGFEDECVVSYTELKVPTGGGIWDSLQPVDQKMFAYADQKALRAGVMHFDASALYDQVLTLVKEYVPATPEGGGVDTQIAMIEQMLGFQIRGQLLGSLEGSYMCYNMGAADLVGMPNGGFAVVAKLKDAAAMQTSLAKLGQFASMMMQGKMTPAVQKTASGKEVNTWTFNLGPMSMFVIPTWAIEGDMLVIGTHPLMAAHVMDQIASGDADKSMMSRSEFKTLLAGVPSDAFSVSLTDSQAQGRQLVMMALQVWPMARMMATQNGIELPMMLPSVDAYIAQMKPGLSYGRKTATGLQWYYKGSGMEASVGGIGGAAGALAVLMPALNKTKKIAQRVVSGTNLKGIGTASYIYANDHDDKFPDNLDVLITECDLSPKSLESPRKPDDFDGPSYILIPGLTDAASPNIVLAYENPDFCDDKVNVLYADGHVAAESKEQLTVALKNTYEYLGKPIPTQ